MGQVEVRIECERREITVVWNETATDIFGHHSDIHRPVVESSLLRRGIVHDGRYFVGNFGDRVHSGIAGDFVHERG